MVKEISQELEMAIAYNEGYEKLKVNDTFNAAQKFLEAELLFPQSDWAPKSALMASYSYYLQNYYSEAMLNLGALIPRVISAVSGGLLVCVQDRSSCENEHGAIPGATVVPRSGAPSQDSQCEVPQRLERHWT